MRGSFSFYGIDSDTTLCYTNGKHYYYISPKLNLKFVNTPQKVHPLQLRNLHVPAYILRGDVLVKINGELYGPTEDKRAWVKVT